ncbi:MAG TPA: threonine synthase [bacterium]|nr:threonine synthase [bacterium]
MSRTVWRGVIEEYRRFLPVADGTPVVTLREGDTPLLHAERLERRVPGTTIYLKNEGVNPTGSFKDRGMTLAITKAVEEGSRGVICASTGNTSASAAAYASRAGIQCFVVVPAGGIALGKIVQALAHGARIVSIEGSFDEALRLVREGAPRLRLTLVNSVNPYRIEGQKTGAFEICDELGKAPDVVAIPVGNAGNITAYWRGFVQYRARDIVASRPAMWGFQAAGAAPLVHGRPVDRPETVASAIRIGRPASWDGAVAAVKESGGAFEAVTDEELLAARTLLAQEEGVFVEPASAAPVAGVLRRAREGRVPDGIVIVCILTGHGLKDPEAVLRTERRPEPVPATFEAIEGVIGEPLVAGASAAPRGRS